MKSRQLSTADRERVYALFSHPDYDLLPSFERTLQGQAQDGYELAMAHGVDCRCHCVYPLRDKNRMHARSPLLESVALQDARQPLERHLIALVGPTAMVARVFSVHVGDTGLLQIVAQQPVAPMQVIVVIGACIEQDAGQLAVVVEAA